MRNPFTTLFLVLAFAPVLCAQDTTATPSRWRFGLSASVDRSYELFYYFGALQSSNIFHLPEYPSWGWSAGAMTEYSFHRHFALTAGMRYKEHKLTTGTLTLMDVNGTTIGTLKINSVSRFIEAPLGIQYTSHPDKRVTAIVNATVTPGYALGEWNYLKVDAPDSIPVSDGPRKSNIDNFNNFSLAAELYAGVGLTFGRCQVQALPQFRFFLTKVAAESVVNRRFYSAGLEVRALCRF
jgi:hypothetical protein